MAWHSPAFDSMLSDNEYDDEDNTPPRPLSGPGASRQTRRLQLRNAGFCGAALPTRKVTPKSMSSSNWSSVSGMNSTSDAENVSPCGRRAGSDSVNGRTYSGVLQEIGNTTLTRPKKPRPRLAPSKMFDADHPAHDAVYANMPASPPPPKTTIRPRSVKTRAKMSNRRRSASAETSKYIEHLEMELAATQSRLSSITSPSVTREQSSKMRTLNAETRQLQAEISDWETKYEQRVQDAVDEHSAIESNLRHRIQSLEQDAEETKYRMQELETQLESATQSLVAVETANVNLEKRLEIMSELLAASPTKIDLHAETPGRSRKHVRPKSMLPRFPTASSLMSSPERQAQTQPTSPMLAFTNYSPSVLDSPSRSVLPLAASPGESDFMSEAESVFSEASAAGDGVTSAQTFDTAPNFNPWNLPIPQHPRGKPARRMRRFGAGSLGPKPLILPSTSHGQHCSLASAPPLERSETTLAFFPPQDESFDESSNPFLGRRRASTTANEITLANLAASPFPEVQPNRTFEDNSIVSLTAPASAESQATTRHFSSFGSMAGRNLMEELSAARTGSPGSTEQITEYHDVSRELSGVTDNEPSNSCAEDTSSPTSELRGSEGSLDPASSVAEAPQHRRARSRSLSIPFETCGSASIFQRLRIIFGDLWRSPVSIARSLVQSAQARMRIPRPLLNVQWWLVGVLLGPMAKRRMLNRSGCCEDLEEQPLLLEDTPNKNMQGDDGMAYGTLCEALPATPTLRRSTAASRGRKRAGSKMRCAHHLRTKHSPWLWIKFSITLAFAIGAAFKSGPGSLLRTDGCSCPRKYEGRRERAEERRRLESC